MKIHPQILLKGMTGLVSEEAANQRGSNSHLLLSICSFLLPCSHGLNMNQQRTNPHKEGFSRMRVQPSCLHAEGSSANLLGRRKQHKAGNYILFGTNRDLKVVNSSCNHTQGYVAWKDRFGFCPLLVQLLLNTKKCLSSTCQTQL